MIIFLSIITLPLFMLITNKQILLHRNDKISFFVVYIAFKRTNRISKTLLLSFCILDQSNNLKTFCSNNTEQKYDLNFQVVS